MEIKISYFDMIIGIDPGISNGSISYAKNDGVLKSVRMPRNLNELNDYLKYLRTISEHPICFIEKVQLMISDSDEKNKGKQFSIKKMLDNYAQLKSLLTANKIPFCQVHPITWQTTLNLRYKGKEETKTERKNRYKKAAGSYFNNIPITLYNSDSLLLIQFGIKKIKFDPEWIQKNLPSSLFNKLF